jgi:hypothetical protein
MKPHLISGLALALEVLAVAAFVSAQLEARSFLRDQRELLAEARTAAVEASLARRLED